MEMTKKQLRLVKASLKEEKNRIKYKKIMEMTKKQSRLVKVSLKEKISHTGDTNSLDRCG